MQSRIVGLLRKQILEMMRLTVDFRRLKVVGIGGTLREGSTSLGALVVELAEKLKTEESIRRAEPVGAEA